MISVLKKLRSVLRKLRTAGFSRFAQKSDESEKDMRATFEQIAKTNGFCGTVSVSGPGSDLVQTSLIAREIPALLERLEVQTILDLPCGDFYWMKAVHLKAQYIGADIVSELIAKNQELYGSSTRQFIVLDLVRDRLPRVDLIFCRDALVHFSLKDVEKAIKNMQRSESTYLLTTTFTAPRENRDIVTGQWRPLNLQLSPFNFPAPLLVINENCTEQEGKFYDKSIALWRLCDLPT